MQSFSSIHAVVSEEKIFEKVYGRRRTTDDGRRTTDDGRRTTDDRRRRTQSDDKSSHCLRQGELKISSISESVLKKSAENYYLGKNFKVQGPLLLQKSTQRNETQTLSVTHHVRLAYQKSAQYLKAFWKKVWKTVISVKISKSKGHNFRKNQRTGMKLEVDL